jgi:YbaB/EbfC DNA-binding family
VLPDAEETIAQVEADARLTQERADKMPAFQAAMAEVRGSAYSAAKDVFVEVDATGRVTGLRLGDQAVARGARRLTQEILAVIAVAQDDVQEKALRRVSRLLGDDDPIVSELRAAASAPAVERTT